jgi:hypothetical protein
VIVGLPFPSPGSGRQLGKEEQVEKERLAKELFGWVGDIGKLFFEFQKYLYGKSA